MPDHAGAEFAGDLRAVIAAVPALPPARRAALALVYATVLATFAGAAYAFWRMATAADTVAAVQWGVGTLLLFQVSVMAKSYMGSHLEANRMPRELKRPGLQLSMLRASRAS